MLGKEKCRILKEIRQKIADENDIPYVTRECTYQGECRGTCPRCESELRYLERQLALRLSMKKGVTVAALCAGMAGMTFAATGCSSAKAVPETQKVEVDELSGEVANIDETGDYGEEIELTGEYDESMYTDDGGDNSTENASSDGVLETSSSDSSIETSSSDGTAGAAAGGTAVKNASSDSTVQNASAGSTETGAGQDDWDDELTGAIPIYE